MTAQAKARTVAFACTSCGRAVVRATYLDVPENCSECDWASCALFWMIYTNGEVAEPPVGDITMNVRATELMKLEGNADPYTNCQYEVALCAGDEVNRLRYADSDDITEVCRNAMYLSKLRLYGRVMVTDTESGNHMLYEDGKPVQVKSEVTHGRP